ncbi:unnamed protein product, partial [Polarella glacialis]
ASSFGGPLSLPPENRLDHHELKAVLSAQAAEFATFKARLADVQRDCTRSEHHLRDLHGELAVATEATASATEQMSAHSVRQGLVLAAGVERSGAEKARLDDELQRMERMLWERDQEIARLRRSSGSIESHQMQLELEIRSQHAARESAGTEARALSTAVAELLADRLQKAPSSLDSVRPVKN